MSSKEQEELRAAGERIRESIQRDIGDSGMTVIEILKAFPLLVARVEICEQEIRKLKGTTGDLKRGLGEIDKADFSG